MDVGPLVIPHAQGTKRIQPGKRPPDHPPPPPAATPEPRATLRRERANPTPAQTTPHRLAIRNHAQKIILLASAEGSGGTRDAVSSNSRVLDIGTVASSGPAEEPTRGERGALPSATGTGPPA